MDSKALERLTPAPSHCHAFRERLFVYDDASTRQKYHRR
jgi:hypothetical protein